MIQSQIHKRIKFNFSQVRLVLDTSQNLFSSARVDLGTQILLGSLRNSPQISYRQVLDLGCGYGIIGLFLKKQHPESEVYCLDRDSLALDFTKHNSDLNGLNINTIAAEGLKNVDQKFELIITNFPAKLGKEGLKEFIYGSSKKLSKKGVLAIVIVKELLKHFKEILRPEIQIIYSQENKGYSIFHLVFEKEITLENPKDLEEEINFFDKTRLIKTSLEFKKDFWLTENLYLIKHFFKKVSSLSGANLINPNRGVYPLLLQELFPSISLNIYSRDIKEIELCKKNILNLGKTEFFHKDFPEREGYRKIIWFVKDELTKEVLEKINILKNERKEIILFGEKKLARFIDKKRPFLKNKGSIIGYV